MVFGVGQIHVTVRSYGNSLGPIECGRARRAAVSRKSGAPRTRLKMNDPGAEIEPQQLMPFAANEEQIARGVKIERTRSVQGSSADRRTVRSGARLAGSSKGGDDSCLRINSAQDVIADLGDVEVARRTELQANGLVQPGLIGRSIVS